MLLRYDSVFWSSKHVTFIGPTRDKCTVGPAHRPYFTLLARTWIEIPKQFCVSFILYFYNVVVVLYLPILNLGKFDYPWYCKNIKKLVLGTTTTDNTPPRLRRSDTPIGRNPEARSSEESAGGELRRPNGAGKIDVFVSVERNFDASIERDSCADGREWGAAAHSCNGRVARGAWDGRVAEGAPDSHTARGGRDHHVYGAARI